MQEKERKRAKIGQNIRVGTFHHLLGVFLVLKFFLKKSVVL